MTVYGNLLLIALRLTFGGSPCPPLWGLISETMIDVCNSLIINKFWDHEKLFDPISNQLNEIISLPDASHFHPAKELSVKLPQNDIGLVDIYIDDSIGVAPDIASNPTRVNRAIALAINSLARPLNENDPLPRHPMTSQKKLLAEGRMDECKVISGWQINTGSLQISLPLDKHLKWIYQIKSIISNKGVSQKQLESLIGRSYHMGSIIPMIRHFLSRLRNALFRSSKSGGTSLSLIERNDLDLMINFLNKANSGISINNVVYRKPTQINRSDASEFGVGGYNLVSGKAWCFELPFDCRLKTSLNSLEFIACMMMMDPM